MIARHPGAFEIVDTFHERGAAYARHHHEASSLFVVLSGRVDDQTGAGSHLACERGASGFLPAGVEHSTRFSHGPVHTLNIVFAANYLERLGVSDLALRHARYCADPAKAVAGHGLLTTAALPESYRRLAVEELVADLLLKTTSSARDDTRCASSPAWITDVVDLLHSGAGEAGLGELAGAVGRNPAHICRTFRAAFGCSVYEYARRLRIEHAAVLLRTSRLPLGQVAVRAGFSDQPHFNRAFKACFGVTPQAYRGLPDRTSRGHHSNAVALSESPS